MALDLTYARGNIVRTVAIGFTLGALVLSIGFIVVLLGLAAFDVEPFSFKNALVRIAWMPVAFLFCGIVLGWIVRLGLGIHAYWRYRRDSRSLQIT